MFLRKASRHSIALSLLLAITTMRGSEVFAESPAPEHAIPIGAEDDWYPYSALRDGRPKGLTVDLVNAIFAASKTPVKLVSVPYTRCMAETRSAKLAGCFDTLRNPLVESQYLWHSTPLFKARIVIYGSSKNTASDLDINALEGKTVAVTNGYDYGKAFDSSKMIKKSLGPMDINGLRKLAEGKVDYAVIYDKNAEILIAENPELKNRIKVVGTLIEPDIYLSFSKTYPDIQTVIKKFDEGFSTIKANGEYNNIMSRWGM